MDLRNDGRAFANGGRHPLGRARPHIADREDAASRGFEWERWARRL
jgi:hypothetical protein